MIRILVALFFLTGCFRVPTKIQPQMCHTITDTELRRRTSAFNPLTAEERKEDWAKELLIAQTFSKDCDLYRAISTYKRAQILIDPQKEERLRQIEYSIVLCYYLANKYPEVIKTFESSELLNVDKSFPAFCDLLTLLYESYLKVNEPDKANRILQLIEKSDSNRAGKLSLQTAIQQADLDMLAMQLETPMVTNALNCYCLNKKSPTTAGNLNALLPGAGFLYLGQTRSAITAFLLNGLFIGATYQFFHKGYTAAALITLSFEMGWYFGGIYGAKEEAKLYNERLYESVFCGVLNEKKLYPIFMIKHTF